jgi:hypothetical protein
MPVTSQSLHYVDLGLSALSVLTGLGALYLWVQAVQWATPSAFATAATWTLVTVFVFALDVAVERVQSWRR